MSAEFTGRWVLRGGVRVAVSDTEPPVPDAWTDRELRKAHAAYVRGVRDPHTEAGNREWWRRHKAETRARLRAGGMSAADRAWCEKAAVVGSWLVDTRTNRASVSNTTI